MAKQPRGGRDLPAGTAARGKDKPRAAWPLARGVRSGEDMDAHPPQAQDSPPVTDAASEPAPPPSAIRVGRDVLVETQEERDAAMLVATRVLLNVLERQQATRRL